VILNEVFLIGCRDFGNVFRPIVTTWKNCCSCKRTPERNITHSRVIASSPWHAPSSPARTSFSSGSLSCSALPSRRPAYLPPVSRPRAALPVPAHLPLQCRHGLDGARLVTRALPTFSTVLKSHDESVVLGALLARCVPSRVTAHSIRRSTRVSPAEISGPQIRPPSAASDGNARGKVSINQIRGKKNVVGFIMTICLNLSANVA
jgi:hypothetical protein